LAYPNPEYTFKKCLADSPDSLIFREGGADNGIKKWYVQNRHVTGLRKMWAILVKSKQ